MSPRHVRGIVIPTVLKDIAAYQGSLLETHSLCRTWCRGARLTTSNVPLIDSEVPVVLQRLKNLIPFKLLKFKLSVPVLLDVLGTHSRTAPVRASYSMFLLVRLKVMLVVLTHRVGMIDSNSPFPVQARSANLHKVRNAPFRGPAVLCLPHIVRFQGAISSTTSPNRRSSANIATFNDIRSCLPRRIHWRTRDSSENPDCQLTSSCPSQCCSLSSSVCFTF